MLPGHLAHGVGVELDVLVVLLAVGDVRVLEVFLGDRGEQHEVRGFLAIVLGGRGLLDEPLEVASKSGQSGGPGERLVDPEDGQEHVGLLVLEGVAVVVEMGLARAEGQLVGRVSQVVDDQLELGEPAMQEGLEVAVILHPLGQGVTDDDDPIALAQLQAQRIGRDGGPTDAEDHDHAGGGQPGPEPSSHSTGHHGLCLREGGISITVVADPASGGRPLQTRSRTPRCGPFQAGDEQAGFKAGRCRAESTMSPFH